MAEVNYEEYIQGLVAKGRKAQEIANNFSQEKVNELTEAIAYALTIPEVAEKNARSLVEESGMGIIEDKVLKTYGKVKGTFAQMKNEKSVGLISRDEKKGIDVYARPMGVIGAIIPVTNGEATPVVKALMAVKTRNAIILAPHPRAGRTNYQVTEDIRDVLDKFGAPRDLVQAIEPDKVSIASSQALMKLSDFILATGGTPMVKQAYSSGTPAIGVGTGNVICIIDESADIAQAADMIVRSKKFDNATSCSTENNIFVVDAVYDKFIEEMAKVGGVLIKDDSEDKPKIVKTLWPETPKNHDLSRQIVAKSAETIAKFANVDIPEGTKIIMVEENGGFGNEYPLTGEKLSPVAGIRRVSDFEDGLEKLLKVLDYQGKGHSISIHTTHDERVKKLGEVVPVCKVVVNQPQALTNSGSWTSGYPVSMTLGCGTWGNNSISHNATYKDLLNYLYISREIPSWQPKDEDLFSDEIRNRF
ncbi:MAG: aldehyde dehydrogenase family protein [Clostridiales Family XIII bacterium]|nr:aldehyde dehydrogenase family protein [Clostridiales Family XIII bacterium]